jgi:uncharacterized repeat protein (TIGR01451 family)
MEHRTKLFFLAFGSGVIAVAAILFGLVGPAEPVRADPGELYVAPGGDCGGASPCYDNVQAAVDAAAEGDVIKVATGVYTGVQARPAPPGYNGPAVVTQVVYISKTVIVQGGYTVTNWDNSDSTSYPTTLDAQRNGRVLFITGDVSPTVEGMRITRGDAVGLGGHWPQLGDVGGGMCVFTATATISNVWIFDNIAVGGEGGGGIFFASGAILNNSRIFSNTAMYAGGLSLHYDTSVLSGNVIVSNTTPGSGASAGGGLSFHGSQATLDGNLVVSNYSGSGGGMFIKESSVTFINTVIADNRAWYIGGAICVQSSSPRFLHTTIARNSGSTGVHLSYPSSGGSRSTIVLTNTILVSHTVGIRNYSPNIARLESTLWSSNGTDWSGADIFHTNDYTGTPAFLSPNSRDYHIGPSSAAINAGVNTGVTEDIDGNPRPLGSGYDIGADEFGDPALVVVKRAATDVVQAGEALSYTISMTNTGNITLTATITDVLPDHVTPAGTLTWTAEIPAPGVWTETVVVTVALSYSGPLTNVVQVTTEEGATGIYTEVTQAEVTPSLTVSQWVSSDPVLTGEQLTYTLRIANMGNVTLTMAVTDVLPGYVVPTGVLTWTGISVAPGEAWEQTVVVTVAFGYEGMLTNAVQVTTEEGATGYSEISSDVVKYSVYLPVVRRE